MTATAHLTKGLPQTYELGTPNAEFASARKKNLGLIFGFVFLVVGEAGILLKFTSPYQAEYGPDMFTTIAIVGVIVAVIGFLLAEMSFRYRQTRVLVFPDGFMQIQANKTNTVRWRDVTEVWQAVTRRYVNGVYTGTTHVYTLRTADGQKIVFGNSIKKVEQLGTLVQQQVNQLRFPGAVSAYNAGQVVNFGPLAVSQMGLTKGNQTVPWNEIQGVQVQKGYIKVKKQGKWLNFANVRVSAVPNVFVFLALVDRIVGVGTKKN